jgi:hypothetical protein
MRLPDPPVPRACEMNQGMMQSIAEGLESVKARVALRWLMLVIAVLNLALAGSGTVGLAIIAKHNSPLLGCVAASPR